jgi:phosphoribosylamine--glycine ligase
MWSKCGEGAGLLKRIQDEGNNCSIYIQEKDYSNVYDGILCQTDSPETNDIIIFDSSGNGQKADYFRKEGFKVFGASAFADKLENDRRFGLDFMLDHGIMVPDTYEFKDFKEAINFVKSNKKIRFVFKPSGKNLPCKLTYAGQDYEDLITYMKFVERSFSKEIDEFILQEFIEGSIVSSEYWVGKNGFIEPINHTIEVKKFMNDDIGPSTGCSGNIVWQGNDDSNLAVALGRVEEDLVKEHYVGPIDINCIINDEGIFGLEWTPRFGLDAMPTLLTLVEDDIGRVISNAVNGQDNEMNLLQCFSGGARVSIPPYPIEPDDVKALQKIYPNENVPILGLEEDNSYFYEVMKQDDMLVHSSGTGVIACVSDIGESPEECYDSVYKILENCKIPDVQYRTDLGKVLTRMYDDIKEVMNVDFFVYS